MDMSTMDTAGITAPPVAAPAAGKAMNHDQITRSAQDFEAVFATQMMTHMFDGLKVDPMFGGGNGEEMFRTKLLDEYGKQMAKNDSFNLVNKIAGSLLQAQEGKH